MQSYENTWHTTFLVYGDLYVEAFLDGFVLSEYQHGVPLHKIGFCGNRIEEPIGILYRKKVDAVFSADIQFADGFSGPILWNLDFKNGMGAVYFHVI